MGSFERAVVVTGAASGIGRAAAELYAERGWGVVAVDVREDAGITQEIVAWMQKHAVAHSTIADRILGCPHEAGTDYPTGEFCPFCSFWRERTHLLKR